MSLLGKILAILNLLMVVALIALGIMDYGKRLELSNGLFLGDLLLKGLPVDDKEIDSTGLAIAPRISSKTLQDIGGGTAKTQQAEALAVAKRFREELSALPDANAKREYLEKHARQVVDQVNGWEDLIRLNKAQSPQDAAILALGLIGRPVFGYHRLPTGYIRRDRLQQILGDGVTTGALAGSNPYIPSSQFLADEKLVEALKQRQTAVEVANWAMLARLDLVFDAAGLVLGDPLSASQGGERKAVEPAEDGIEKVLDLPQRKEAIAHFLWIMRPQGQGADEVANLTRLGVVAGPKALHDCLEEEARVERVMQQEIDLRLQKASERFAEKYQGRLDELNQYALELARLKKEVNMVKELIDKQPMLIEERKQNLAQLQNKLVFTQGDSKARFQAMQQNALNLYDQRRAMMGLLEQISQVEKELRGLESKAGN